MKKIIFKSLVLLILVMSPFLFVACNNNSGEPSLTSIEVRVPSTKKTYSAFEQFEDEGLILRATYSDGRVVDILSGWTISYVGANNDGYYHSDCFYGGESKIKIDYQGQSCYMNINKVEKINRDEFISINEYSQIATGDKIELPTNFVEIKNASGENVQNAQYKLIYCTEFIDFDNYTTTSSDDGAIVSGGAPINVGSYRVFAKIDGDDNYTETYSNVAEFNIIDEDQIALMARNGEEFFAWKEPQKTNQTNQAYIQFEICEIDEVKQIKYDSTFAGSGIAMIFDNHITLVGEDFNTYIKYQTDKILINNDMIELEKWTYPTYLGTYEKKITISEAAEYGIVLEEDKICCLNIYIDESKKDGIVYFSFNCLWVQTEDVYFEYTYNGKVTFSDLSQIANLAFIIDGSELLFKIDNINLTKPLTEIDIKMNAEREISSGKYEKKIA